MSVRSLFDLPRKGAPWLAVAAVCLGTSLALSGPPGQAVATSLSGQPVPSSTAPAASDEAGPTGTADSAPHSPPLVTPDASAAATASASAAATGTPGPARRRAASTAAKSTRPTGCCATGGGVAQAGLFEDLEFLSGSALSNRLDQYAAVGARVARFQLIWENVQSGGPTSYEWQYIDAVISGLLARGIEPLPVIDTAPTWAKTAGCTAHVCAPADPNTYATFAAAAANRYAPQGVHNWEIWNEPNIPQFWLPAPSASAYTALLKAAYAAIHRADPNATVISGGLAPTATQSGRIAPVEFLSEIYASGGAGSFDAVGWHPYSYSRSPGSSADTGWSEMSATGTSARSLMIAHGDGNKRIWATEFGAPTCTGDSTCVSETQQASDITDAYALWRSYSWAGPLISYMYQDTGTDQANREDFFGFVRHDGSQKPAFSAYHAAAIL